MKILIAHKLNPDLSDADFEAGVRATLKDTGADALVFSRDTEQGEHEFSFSFEDEEDEAVEAGYSREIIMGQSILLKDSVVGDDELRAVCSLILDVFPAAGTILQIGHLDGAFAAVASEVGTVYVVADMEDANEAIYNHNIQDKESRVRTVGEATPYLQLRDTPESFQPDAVLLVDCPEEEDFWPHFVRHLKPAIPTPVIAGVHDAARLTDYLAANQVPYEAVEPVDNWVALRITPVYAREQNDG